MGSVTWVVVAAVVFVGSHLLLASGGLRGPLVARLGEKGFRGVYSVVALASLIWLAVAAARAPLTAPLWPVGDALWALVSLVMLCASILFLGSLLRNPAMAALTGSTGAAPQAARGVYAVTRHPMMWSFALWGLCHIAVFPVARVVVVAAAIVVLSLAGAALQDRKKERLEPGLWRAWESKTSFWPFAAIAQGRARFGGFRPHDLFGGLVFWLFATWAHIPGAGVAAGIWRWI